MAETGICAWSTRRCTRRTATAKTWASAKKHACSWHSKRPSARNSAARVSPRFASLTGHGVYASRAHMTIDTAELQRQLAATWLQALNAVIVVIVALVGHRVALNWTGRAMRRARVDTSTQILVKRAMAAGVFT